jgi:hypothetical protein
MRFALCACRLFGGEERLFHFGVELIQEKTENHFPF